ncbi:MAG: hypothetical protein JNK48_27505 [Bryobacterales bacterium]|nr:hypothetical protein [Bryobacterales bacterium]
MRLALPFMLLLTGCGYVGDPQPPALHIPMRVEDLTLVQRGDTLRLSFTLPKITTEGLTITEPGEVDVRIGAAAQGAFDADGWAAGAERVVADATQAGNGRLSVETKVGGLAGRDAIAMVRTSGKSGRWSEWSNAFVFVAVAPLRRPESVEAKGSAEGIVISWSGNAPRYRIERKGEKEPEFAVAGESGEPAFTDHAAEFGKPYLYRVTGFQQAGNRTAESEVSAELKVNIEDTFAPAVPTGLAGLIGVNSVELAWERNIDKDLRGYRVYRAVGEGQWERIAELVEAPAHGDRKVQAGTVYRYAVTSVDMLGNESAKSGEAKVAIP